MSEVMEGESCRLEEASNPARALLRQDRMPHLWCSGCGIGTALNCLIRGLLMSEIDLRRTAIVSGIGCSGRVAGYMNLDSFHTTHGRAVPFATGMKLGNPDLNVIVFSGDGDLFAIGGNHFIHAARRNVDLLVICVNNLVYSMTGGQVASTTPVGAKATTAPYGNVEPPFNTCFLADCCGAAYIARWTTYHVVQLAKTIQEALRKRGFRYIEIISSCPTLYARRNKLGSGLDAMRYYEQNSRIQDGAKTRAVDLGFQSQIVVGKFIDRPDRAVICEATDKRMLSVLGNNYVRLECEE